MPDTIPILTVYYDPNQAYLPGPYNNETDVSPLDMPLTWKTNVATADNDVWFGTSAGSLEHKVTIATDTDPNMSWMPDVALAAEATYFWRIDTDSSEGQVWRFTVKSNDPPTVDAGNTRIAYLSKGGTITLDGSVTDDLLPDWGTVTTTWYVESKPDGASVTFDPDASDMTAEATFDLLGDYVLRLQASDGEEDANDLMNVLVLERPLVEDSRLPTDDAYVNNQNDTNRDRNYGAGGDLNVRSGNNTRLSYLKFDLSDVVGNIRLATLALNPSQDMDDTQASAVTYGSGEWFEGTGPASGTDPNDYSGVGITWNSDDLVWGSQLDEVLGIVADTTYEFDVTDMAIESDGKATFGLTTSRDDGVYSWRSKEVDNENRWPVLTIIYDPNQAYRPGNLGGPRDGEIEVHPRPDAFTWKAGGDTTFNRFYFGTDENNLIQLGPVLAASPGADMSVDILALYGELLANTTYFWRVDSDYSDGEIWESVTMVNHPDAPMLLTPANGAIDAPPVELSWSASDTVDLEGGSYELHLSTDLAAVQNLIALVATLDADTLAVEIANLDLETVYYW
ncbi:MAG: DNRLRE domain-containing protein, partial [Planctomycetes bacterium]|nr:DNRLRE domain-containing protein [Planctomycetota bacterium]